MAENYNLSSNDAKSKVYPFHRGFHVKKGPDKGYLYEKQMAAVMNAWLIKNTQDIVVPPPAGAAHDVADIEITAAIADDAQIAAAAAALFEELHKDTEGGAPTAAAVQADEDDEENEVNLNIQAAGTVLCALELKTSEGADFGQFAIEGVLNVAAVPHTMNTWIPAENSVTYSENGEWVDQLMNYLKKKVLNRWNLTPMSRQLQSASEEGLVWVKTKGGERLSNTTLTEDPNFFNIKKKTNGEIVLKGTTGCILPFGMSYQDLYTWLIMIQDEMWREWIPTKWNEIQSPPGKTRPSTIPDVPAAVVASAAAHNPLGATFITENGDEKWNKQVSSAFSTALTKKMWEANQFNAAELVYWQENLNALAEENPYKWNPSGVNKQEKIKARFQRMLAEQFQADMLRKAHVYFKEGCVGGSCGEVRGGGGGGAAAAAAAVPSAASLGAEGTRCELQSAASKREFIKIFDAPRGTSFELNLPISKGAIAPYYLLKKCQFLQIGMGNNTGLYSLGGVYTFMDGSTKYIIPSFYDSIVDSSPSLRLRLKPTGSFFGAHDFKVAVKIKLNRATGRRAAAKQSERKLSGAAGGGGGGGDGGSRKKKQKKDNDPAIAFLNLNLANHRNAFLAHIVELARTDQIIGIVYDANGYPFKTAAINIPINWQQIKTYAIKYVSTSLGDSSSGETGGRGGGGGGGGGGGADDGGYKRKKRRTKRRKKHKKRKKRTKRQKRKKMHRRRKRTRRKKY